MSALGLLISPLAFEVARSRRIHVADIDAADFAATFRALEAEATAYLLSAGVAEARHPPRSGGSTCATRARATRSR